MDSTEESLVAAEELEGDDEAEIVGHDRKIGDDEVEKIGGQNILRDETIARQGMQAVNVEDSVWDNLVTSIDEILMRMNFGGKLSPTHISFVEKQDNMVQVVLQSPNATQESIYMCVDTKTNKNLSAHSPNKASMSKGKGVYEPPVIRSSPRTKGKEDWTSEHAPTRSSSRAKGKEIVICEPICTRSSPRAKGKGIIISEPICTRTKGKGIVISEPASENNWDDSSDEIVDAKREHDSSDSSEVSLVHEDDIFDNKSEDEPDALDRIEHCSWRIHASLFCDGITFQVARQLVQDVKANASMDIKAMENTLMGRYGLVRPKHILRIAKNKIIDMLQGKQEESYQYLARPKLRTLAARAANAYNHFVHKKALDALEKENPATVTWLLDEPKEHWCRYLFDTTTKSPNNCTNFVKSFNDVINWYRDRHVFALCEYIREKWTQWIVQRREIVET
ncbi:hypothetical protein Cgig2_028265 [Carnegiea gigantea]|uniref:Uncharacterized protein n=1 Tax=Carnegiea gigantea TaxID=171969 RepID=A0A9Q1GMZ2_9CARY|nr:hypothetical protein Cgig2_028265 [Carnegiea gigantea]